MSHYKLAISVALITLWGVATFAQEAKVPVIVNPPQAYVFLDGVAIKEGKQVILKTAPGEHVISVYNYGYVGQIRHVEFVTGWNEVQSFSLEPAGAQVPGAYGLIQIEGPGHAAVLLNGTTPEYHVGHVDMFNNHIGWFQQLLVPPGTHQLTITRYGNTIWSGPVQVAAGERVILYVPSGKRRTQVVNKGNGPRPRFNAGVASAAVTIAPVSGTFAASPSQINCSETSQLAYSSVDTLHSSIKDAGPKPLPALSGDVPVSPRQTTTYTFEASGPGGLVKQDATVNVNPVVQSSLETTPAEIHYLKVGNKVLTQESSELKWTSTNADSISVEPIGKVAATGQEKLMPEPKQVTGPISESQSYTLTATNVCGGSDSKTAQLKITGVIEPYILSVFFPTGYPDRKHPDTGLVASQQEELTKVAKVFPIYTEHTPDAKIVVRGNADRRGTDKYNMALSERRVAVVKAFLVSHGIPEDKILLEPMGETKQLDAATVQQLEAENMFKDESKKHNTRATWLAYNRRIDIEVQPADLQTTRFFPHQANDADLLLQPTWPSLKKVVDAEQTSTVVGVTGAQ
jgi:OmpA family